eukprot:1547533-Rhodomonas_salina.1
MEHVQPGLCECNSQVRISSHKRQTQTRKEDSTQKERGKRGESEHLSAVKGLMSTCAVLEKRRCQCCLPFWGSLFWPNRQ